jgi:hypothetical protein
LALSLAAGGALSWTRAALIGAITDDRREQFVAAAERVRRSIAGAEPTCTCGKPMRDARLRDALWCVSAGIVSAAEMAALINAQPQWTCPQARWWDFWLHQPEAV